MSGDVNKVIVIGNIGSSVDIKKLNSGTTLASFSIATNEKYKKADGTTKEETEWHSINIFGKLAEVVENLGIGKGDKVYIEGKLSTNKWESEDGQKHERKNIIARELKVQAWKNKKEDGGSNSAPTSKPVQNSQPAQNDAEESDDLPF